MFERREFKAAIPMSRQLLDEVKRRLEPEGVFGLNLAAGLGDPFSRAVYRTVEERFRPAHAAAAWMRLVLGYETIPGP